MVPAQTERSVHTIASYTHNPPTPRLLMYGLARIALKLGIEAPADQVRFVFSVVGVFAFLVSFLSLQRIFQLYNDERKTLRLSVGLLLYSFYFLGPLFSSRALVESFALPYLTLSMALTSVYYKERRLSQGVLALVVLALGSLMRFQLGLCALAVFLVPILIRRLKDFFPLLLTSLVLFLATGFYDQVFSGSFHGGLKSYFFYNLHFVGDHYGRQPFYVFLLLFIGLSIPPTFIRRWKGFPWKAEFEPLKIILFAFVLFVFFHSLSPHKEERFMIPILPLFLVLLTPFLTELVLNKAWVRVGYFAGLNFFLLFFTTVEIPQKNIVFLMTYLDRHPEIKTLVGVKDTLVIYPSAFLRKSVTVLDTKEGFQPIENLDCESAVAVRKDLEPMVSKFAPQLSALETFSPGLLEGLVVKLNPKYNFRRAAITLYKKKGC